MGTAIGSVDQRRRPIVRVELPDNRTGILALPDTGFNGDILCDHRDLETLNVTLQTGYSTVELAGGVMQEVHRGWTRIIWLGRHRRVDVIVLIHKAATPLPAADEPVALVGTGLLWPNLLMIDFNAQTVEIEEGS